MDEHFFKPSTEFFTLTELLDVRATQQPEKRAFTFLLDGEVQEQHWTYAELNRRALSIGAALQRCMAVGERALLLYMPGLEFIAAFFGCLYAGVIAVPAYPPRRNQKVLRLQSIVADAKATAALTTTSLLNDIQNYFAQNLDLAELRWLATDEISSAMASDWQKPALTSNTLAFLQYTSGSTGTPKGVMVNHGNLLHNSYLIHRGFEHTLDSQGVIWLPPYHDMGLIGGVIQPLYGGFPVTLMSPVAFLKKPFNWLQAISRYRATTSGGPDFAYDLASRKITPEQLKLLDLSSWKVAFNGAETIRAQTLDRFAATFEPCGFSPDAFYSCYGLAESTLMISGGIKAEPPNIGYYKRSAIEQQQVVLATDKEDIRAIVSCGQPCSDYKIAIVNPESLVSCLNGQIGEIWVSSPSGAQGYWRQTKETNNTFQAYLADTGEGPFLRTGDLGFLFDNELYVTGRLKDMIIILGRNYYPQDIELTVEQSHPALRLGCGAAFSVEIASQEKLIIVQELKRFYLRKLDRNEIIKAIIQAVAEEQDLQVYAILLLKTASLPKTSSGKIQRYACRDGFLRGSLDVVADWSANPQNKAEFLHLEMEVESLFKQLQADKQQKIRLEDSECSNLTKPKKN